MKLDLSEWIILLISLPPIYTDGRCSLCGSGTGCDGRNCLCRNGYQMRTWNRIPRTYSCRDVNECTIGVNLCKTGTICVNKLGSYDCQCLPGWFGPWVTTNGEFTCTERSLCEIGYHRCGPGTECHSSNNISRSYTCVCASGYTSKTISPEEEMYTCSDIDECIDHPASEPVCGENSDCTNTPGSFHCNCQEGFQSAWKDDINCNIVATQESSAMETVSMYQLGLAVGVSVIVLIIIITLTVYLIRRRRDKHRDSINTRYRSHSQPIQISVSTGRESNYVNVTLTSEEGTAGNGTTEDDKPQENGSSHIYSNELFGLKVNLTKNPSCSDSIKKPPRQRGVSSSSSGGYVNHGTIRRVERAKSDRETANHTTSPRIPFSDSSEPIPEFGQTLASQRSNSCEKRRSHFDSEYDRLCRSSSNTMTSELVPADYAEHIYARPDDVDGEDNVSLESDSVFDHNETLAHESTILCAEKPPTLYEPVIYSIPNKPKKQDSIYVNNSVPS